MPIETADEKRVRLIREGKIRDPRTGALAPSGPPDAAPKVSALKMIAGTIVGVIVLAVIVVGIAWWEGWITIYGTRGFGTSGKDGRANNTACTRNGQCASDRCTSGRCQAGLARGDECTYDRECSSGTCSRATANAASRTCR